MRLKVKVRMAENETRGLWNKETYPKAWVPRSVRQAQRTVRCDWRASPRSAEYETRKLGGCQIINKSFRHWDQCLKQDHL